MENHERTNGLMRYNDMNQALTQQTGLNQGIRAASSASAGLAGIGVWLVRAAIADPEPTSKLFLLLGGGVLCILGGGLSLIKSLGGHAPSRINANPQSLDIRW